MYMPDYSGFLTNFSGSQNTSTDLMSNYTSVYVNSLTSNAGYMYIGNILLQFTTNAQAYWPTTTGTGTNHGVDITFPVPFAQVPFTVQLTPSTNNAVMSVINMTTTGFTAVAGQNSSYFTWLAIGAASVPD